jgi:hypothetical protein
MLIQNKLMEMLPVDVLNKIIYYLYNDLDNYIINNSNILKSNEGNYTLSYCLIFSLFNYKYNITYNNKYLLYKILLHNHGPLFNKNHNFKELNNNIFQINAIRYNKKIWNDYDNIIYKFDDYDSIEVYNDEDEKIILKADKKLIENYNKYCLNKNNIENNIIKIKEIIRNLKAIIYRKENKLPFGYKLYYDKINNKHYYYNIITEKKQWNIPISSVLKYEKRDIDEFILILKENKNKYDNIINYIEMVKNKDIILDDNYLDSYKILKHIKFII